MQPICACFTVTHFHKLFSPFWLPKGKMLSGLVIRHPGQRRVPLLVINTYVSLMYELTRKIEKVFTNKFIGTGPSSYEKKNLLGPGLTKVEKH